MPRHGMVRTLGVGTHEVCEVLAVGPEVGVVTQVQVLCHKPHQDAKGVHVRLLIVPGDTPEKVGTRSDMAGAWVKHRLTLGGGGGRWWCVRSAEQRSAVQLPLPHLEPFASTSGAM